MQNIKFLTHPTTWNISAVSWAFLGAFLVFAPLAPELSFLFLLVFMVLEAANLIRSMFWLRDPKNKAASQQGLGLGSSILDLLSLVFLGIGWYLLINKTFDAFFSAYTLGKQAEAAQGDEKAQLLRQRTFMVVQGSATAVVGLALVFLAEAAVGHDAAVGLLFIGALVGLAALAHYVRNHDRLQKPSLETSLETT